MTIMFSGDLQSTLDPGANVVATASLSGYQVMQQNFAVCDTQQCPVQPGDQTFYQDFQVPSYAPTGDYTVNLKGTTQDGQAMSCLNFKVHVQQ